MKSGRMGRTLVTCLVICGWLAITSVGLAASHETLLHKFTGTPDGGIPVAGVVFDSAGNLYGTTATGGAYGYGSVFELQPGPGGTWSETVLHSFAPNSADGIQPRAGLVVDGFGTLYGTTQFGGDYNEGTVFQISPDRDGVWNETILHSFDGTHGGRPTAGLILDDAGNLYGTTYGSPYWCGTVFRLAPSPDGAWTHTILHNFGRIKNAPGDGCQPSAGLVRDRAGNLYGTTSTGGANIYFGTIFRLKERNKGKWKETVLHSFTSSNGDGAYPYDSLALDNSANLYGTTFAGGIPNCFAGCGIAFKLAPSAGQWKEKTLYSFTGGSDGAEPYAGLIRDAAGDWYGATNFGGSSCSSGCGVVFKLTRRDKGKWTETVLHRFSGGDGDVPNGNLVSDFSGNLFGTTLNGGEVNSNCPAGCGVVFELTP